MPTQRTRPRRRALAQLATLAWPLTLGGVARRAAMWMTIAPAGLLTACTAAGTLAGTTAGTATGTTTGTAIGTTAASLPLRGTTWVWVPLHGPLPARQPPGPHSPQLRLDPVQPRASGHTGCNRLMADFTLQGAALRFSPAVTTRMACLDANNREPVFLLAFEAVRGWRIDGPVLLLSAAHGQPVMRLLAAPE